jgi:hypothetical protein
MNRVVSFQTFHDPLLIAVQRFGWGAIGFAGGFGGFGLGLSFATVGFIV